VFASNGVGESIFLNMVISPAFAEEATLPQGEKAHTKATIMLGVFLVLGCVYVTSIYKVFFSTNPNNVDSAADLLNTLTGFFVGVGTSFIG